MFRMGWKITIMTTMTIMTNMTTMTNMITMTIMTTKPLQDGFEDPGGAASQLGKEHQGGSEGRWRREEVGLSNAW